MKFKLLVVMMLPFVVIISQSNFKPGYLITLTNDTIYGLIDFRTDYSNAEVCRYMKSPDTAVESFLPGSIAGYRFVNEGKYYVSKTVDLEGVERKFFLEFMLQGLVNLYYLPLNRGYFFFEVEGGKMVGVTQKPDEIYDGYRLRVDNQYKGVVSYLFKDCLPLAVKVDKLEFDRASMIKFTKEYHDRVCVTGESCVIFENDYKRSFIKVDYTVFSGAELWQLTIKMHNEPQMYSISPVLGGVVHFSNPRLLSSLIYSLEGSMSSISFNGNYSYGSTNNFRLIYNSFIARIVARMEYVSQKGFIRPAVGVGLNFNFLLNPERIYENNNHSLITGPYLKSRMICPEAGFGFDIVPADKNALTIRFLYSFNESLPVKTNILQLRLGYTFR
jgi:hypothetical protein